ncbi:MAG: Gfo/Idh/MocA family oxidoreductase [Calditrichaeota bacterium]|nr:Gfo/Idh/MocA family oxidoreductase [Calditrichota bacterium]
MNRKNDTSSAEPSAQSKVIKQLRIGVIGAGGISQMAHIPNLLSEAGIDLVALCDSDPRRAAMVAEKFAIPVWFDQPDALFEHTHLDAVVIATPTITHPVLCRLALESGVDVLLEKPFARTVEEGRTIVESVERTGRLLMVAMNHRFRPDTVQLRRVVKRGELGAITMVRAGWLKRLGVWGRPYWFTDPRMAGGGVMFDLGLQMIDLALFLLDFPHATAIAGGSSSQTLELAVEDSASAYIRIGDDVPFLLEVSWANCDDHDKAYLWLSGTHGAAALSPLRIIRRQIDQTMKTNLPSFGDEVKLYRNSFKAELAHFLSCVRTRQQPLSTAAEAFEVLEVISRWQQVAGL